MLGDGKCCGENIAKQDRSGGLGTRGEKIFANHISDKENFQGAWVAQLVKHPTSAQVVISRFASLSPASVSGLTAQSLEPASDFVSPSLSASPLLTLCSFLSKINKH